MIAQRTTNVPHPEPSAIDRYRAALPPGRLEGLRIDPLDRLGIPTYCTTFWPDRGPSNGGNGYGLTEAIATTGALGELNEVVAAHDALARMPRRSGSYEALVAALGTRAVLDPLTTCLDAGSPYTPSMTLDWVAARRYPSGEPVWVPIEFAACQGSDVPPGDYLITPITNGLGAGMGHAQALCHGLLELLQRDGNGLRFRALDAGIVVDLDAVRTPGTVALLAQLDAAGVEVFVKLACTEFGIANLYVVGLDRPGHEDGPPIVATACGEAADPSRERALQKALLEFAAARARKAFTHGPLDAVAAIVPPGYMDRFLGQSLAGEEPRALAEMVQWLTLDHAKMRALLADTALHVRERVPFSTLPDVPAAADPQNAADRLPLVANRLFDAGLEVLYLDFSPDLRHGVHVVKAIVPGLEVETMSYGRIGERNARRLLDAGSNLVGLGTPPDGARMIPLTEAAYARLGGRPWLDWPAVLRTVGTLYPLYREPGRHSAPMVAAGLAAPA